MASRGEASIWVCTRFLRVLSHKYVVSSATEYYCHVFGRNQYYWQQPVEFGGHSLGTPLPIIQGDTTKSWFVRIIICFWNWVIHFCNVLSHPALKLKGSPFTTTQLKLNQRNSHAYMVTLNEPNSMVFGKSVRLIQVSLFFCLCSIWFSSQWAYDTNGRVLPLTLHPNVRFSRGKNTFPSLFIPFMFLDKFYDFMYWFKDRSKYYIFHARFSFHVWKNFSWRSALIFKLLFTTYFRFKTNRNLDKLISM